MPMKTILRLTFSFLLFTSVSGCDGGGATPCFDCGLCPSICPAGSTCVNAYFMSTDSYRNVCRELPGRPQLTVSAPASPSPDQAPVSTPDMADNQDAAGCGDL